MRGQPLAGQQGFGGQDVAGVVVERADVVVGRHDQDVDDAENERKADAKDRVTPAGGATGRRRKIRHRGSCLGQYGAGEPVSGGRQAH